MEINKKNSRRIIIISIVIILIGAVIFLVVNKNENDKIKTSEKNKAAINAAQVKKNSAKTSKGNSTTSTDTTKSGKSVDNKSTTNQGSGQTALQKQALILKQQNAQIAATQKKAAIDKIENAKVKDSKDGIIVFVKAANFGSMAEIIKDNSKFSSYKYYQFFLGNTKISAIESITKGSTTIYPTQKAGTEVEVSLMGQDKKVIKKVKVKLSARK